MSKLGYIFSGIILILVVAGAYFLISPSLSGVNDEVASKNPDNINPTEDASSTPLAGDTNLNFANGAPALINFTENGYEPKEIKIKRGETVRFLNKSSKETWPASAIHPTHSAYPEKSKNDCLGSAFDACRGLKSGEYWDFTFNATGSWRYHDHLRTSQTGVVIVE